MLIVRFNYYQVADVFDFTEEHLKAMNSRNQTHFSRTREKSGAFDTIAVAKNQGSQADWFKFLCQHLIVHGRNGNDLNTIPDFYYPRQHLAFEDDREVHVNLQDWDNWCSLISQSNVPTVSAT